MATIANDQTVADAGRAGADRRTAPRHRAAIDHHLVGGRCVSTDNKSILRGEERSAGQNGEEVIRRAGAQRHPTLVVHCGIGDGKNVAAGANLTNDERAADVHGTGGTEAAGVHDTIRTASEAIGLRAFIEVGHGELRTVGNRDAIAAGIRRDAGTAEIQGEIPANGVGHNAAINGEHVAGRRGLTDV